MNKIVLFRYHDHLEICKDHLNYFKYFNPKIPVYGLYGGDPKLFELFSKELTQLEDNYCLKHLSADSKWKSFDLVLKEWFQYAGKQIVFDQLYLLEWDFILLDSLDSIYSEIMEGEAGFSGLVQLSKIEKKWYWTGNAEKRKEWLSLLNHIKSIYKYNQKPVGILCPGLTLPRCFFEGFMDIELPELGNDELRIPLYTQILNIPMKDTRFYRKWFSKREWKCFNCNNFEIDQRIIDRQFSKKRGRRAFHPVREKLNPDQISHVLGYLKTKGF